MKLPNATGLPWVVRKTTELVSKKRATLTKFSLLLLNLANHGIMGVAVGLTFAFLASHITGSGIPALIGHSADPASALLSFVGTCAACFGIGATLTGAIMTLTENNGINGRTE
jgi:hypothetical protein